jgi:hypothetical protein
MARPIKGIYFVVDGKDRKVAVQIDLKRYGPYLEDFFDVVISESRRTEKGIPYKLVRAASVKRSRLRE